MGWGQGESSIHWVRSSNVHNFQSWAKLKPGSQNLSQRTFLMRTTYLIYIFIVSCVVLLSLSSLLYSKIFYTQWIFPYVLFDNIYFILQFKSIIKDFCKWKLYFSMEFHVMFCYVYTYIHTYTYIYIIYCILSKQGKCTNLLIFNIDDSNTQNPIFQSFFKQKYVQYIDIIYSHFTVKYNPRIPAPL